MRTKFSWVSLPVAPKEEKEKRFFLNYIENIRDNEKIETEKERRNKIDRKRRGEREDENRIRKKERETERERMKTE